MDIKFLKIFSNFIIAILIFLFALSFYQVKSYDENILPINLPPFPGENEFDNQFQVEIKFPKLIFKKQKSQLQFDLIQIDSMIVNSSIDTTGVISPDLYEKFSVNFESRLELPGIHSEPLGVVSQNFVKNKILTYKWDLYPASPGIIQGTLWLYINLIPIDSSGDPIHEILLAKPIQINVFTIFGLSIIWIRIFLVILIISSLYLRFKLILNKK